MRAPGTNLRLKTIAFLFIFSCFGFIPHTLEARSRKEKDAIASRVLWTKEFSGAITHLELLSKNGLLHVVAREGMKKPSGVKKEDWPKKRYIINESGSVIWQGDARLTALIADDPFPVLLVAEDKKLFLEATNKEGGVAWRHVLEGGVPISTLADPSGSKLIIVQLPYEWMERTGQAYPAKMTALDLATGGTLWVSELQSIRGDLGSFAGDLSVNEGTLWWVGGRRALAADPITGRIHWQSPIDDDFRGPRHWSFDGERAFASNGSAVWAFSAADGFLWKKTLPKGFETHGLFLDSGRLALSSFGDKEFCVELIEAASGNVFWKRSFKHKKKKLGVPPLGVAFAGERIAFAAEKKVVGLQSSSGETLYERKVKPDIFARWDRLTLHKKQFVLSGSEGAYAYDLAGGEPLWQENGFIDPVSEQRMIRQTALQAGLSSLHSLHAPDAQKAWKQYSSGSRSFTDAAMTAGAAQRSYSMIQAEKLDKTSANFSKGLTRFIEIDLAVVNRALGDRYGSFYLNRGGKLLKSAQNVDAALVDMETGQLTEIRIEKASTACISQILIAPENRKVYQTFRQMALLCDDENKLIAYGY